MGNGLLRVITDAGRKRLLQIHFQNFLENLESGLMRSPFFFNPLKRSPYSASSVETGPRLGVCTLGSADVLPPRQHTPLRRLNPTVS